MKLLSSGTTTSNINGNFEVEYTIDSFWRKLFGMKTKFKFHTFALPEHVSLSHYPEYCANWYDESNEVVTNSQVLTLIGDIISKLNTWTK